MYIVYHYFQILTLVSANDYNKIITGKKEQKHD